MTRRLLRRRDPEKARGLLVRFENRILIERPIADVFGFVADFRNVPKWNYFVESVEQETKGPIGLGTRYHQIRKHDEQRFKVTEYEPFRLVTVQTEPGSVPAFTMRFRLEPKAQGTLVHDAWELDTVEHRIVARLLGRKIAREAAANLAKLKELLETGHTMLQDGRTMKR